MNHTPASYSNPKVKTPADEEAQQPALSVKRRRLLPLQVRRQIRDTMAVVDRDTLARHLGAQAPTVWLPTSPLELLFAGIDGGISGAIARLDRHNHWNVQPAVVKQDHGHNVLDEEGNLLLLRTLAEQAGGVHRLIVVYEAFRKNTDWGIKNSFACGRHDEFWRVLLSTHRFRFVSVDPKTWQAYCFSGLAKAEPKERALKFVQQNCQDLAWLEAFPKTEQQGIVDAMCIALWAKHQQGLGQL